MIDTTADFIMAPVASSAGAKTSALASRKSGREPSGFAQLLADSAVEQDIKIEASAVSVSPDILIVAEDRNDATASSREDGAIAVDLAAMLALVAAENSQVIGIAQVPASAVAENAPGLAIPAPPTRGAPAVDFANSAPPVMPAVGTTADMAPAASTRRGAAASHALGDHAKMSALSLDAAESAPVSDAALVATPASITDSMVIRAPATSIASQSSASRREAESVPAIEPAKSAQVTPDSVAEKIDEPRQQAAYRVETASIDSLAMGIGAHASGTHSLLPASQTATLLIPAHADSPAWSKDFGQHIIRLAVEGQPRAEIHLNPPAWGPIRVSIEVNGQDATLQFSAAHPQTRDALEAAMPRLRELFSAQNLIIVGANIGDDPALTSTSPHFSGSPGQHFDQPQPPAGDGRRARALVMEDPASAPVTLAPPVSTRSLVDLFA
jgi:flagellar hook-length control protein FliK